MIRTVIAIGAAAGIVCPPVALYASSIGAGMSVDAEPAPEPPQARTAAALPITTYAPIFPTPTADQPQPWTETDGPLHAPTPGQDSMGATEADARPATPSSRAQAAATPSAPVAPSTAPQPVPDPAATPPSDVAGAEPARPITAGVLDLVNAARAEAGCLPIADDPELTDYAQQWAQTQAAERAMSHSSGPYAENVAVGYESAADVMAGWLDSSRHKANIENCAWTRHGIGAGTVDGRTYWTQVFST